LEPSDRTNPFHPGSTADPAGHGRKLSIAYPGSSPALLLPATNRRSTDFKAVVEHYHGQQMQENEEQLLAALRLNPLSRSSPGN
jgi:hypothetical protein